MRYFEVYVAESGYQKSEPLTYAHPDNLPVGSLVLVPFGRKHVSGFVVREVSKPDFPTKPVEAVLGDKPLPDVPRRFHAWMSLYYPSGSGAITQLFVPSGLQVKPRALKTPQPSATSAELPDLTPQQQTILHQIDSTPTRTFLLHGETGSGKSRIYFESVRQTITAGKSALLLVPEISLVPQLSELFTAHFGAQVAVLHSGLSKAARNRNWLRILHAEEPMIIIGTRSALFAPIAQLGLIAVDEMHEPAYKQESAPRYYALRAAAQLARLHDAKIIYGSATPPIMEYYVASQTGATILRMSETAKPTAPVTRSIVDLKQVNLFTRHRYLSDQLLDALAARLARREQSLLFLNRRGTARAVLCQDCGWQALCPRCDMPLTYHGDHHRMRCHTCGYSTTPPYACPQCNGDDIVYQSLGTKALVEALHSLFPEALIRRFDTDNLAADQLHRQYDSIKAGEVDILVGTQMLGKGLDLPKLSLVGVVNADTSLSMPDFSSNERGYQLLHQAIGRVGRGHTAGEVIVQSFNPSSPLLQAAIRQEWHMLYESELAERERFGFPPFYFLLKLTVSRRTSQAAESYLAKLHQVIRSLPLKLKIDEPTPGFYERSHGRYNWQLVIRARDRGQLLQVIANLPAGDYTYDLDPLNLL